MTEETGTFAANVIVFREDPATWVALALEMDVRGYGLAPEAAIQDVVEMLDAQVSYAVQMGHPESVWRRAEDKYWRMWEKARERRFVADASGSEAPTDEIADLVSVSLLALKHRDQWTAASA